MEFYIEKVYCNMKKLFSTKNFQTSKKVKNGYFVNKVSEKENVYCFYFLVFNKNIEINRKLLKK